MDPSPLSLQEVEGRARAGGWGWVDLTPCSTMDTCFPPVPFLSPHASSSHPVLSGLATSLQGGCNLAFTVPSASVTQSSQVSVGSYDGFSNVGSHLGRESRHSSGLPGDVSGADTCQGQQQMENISTTVLYPSTELLCPAQVHCSHPRNGKEPLGRTPHLHMSCFTQPHDETRDQNSPLLHMPCPYPR